MFRNVPRRTNLRRKYGNTPTTVGNYRYDSKLEADYSLLLQSLEQGGIIQNIERQVRYDFVINGKKLNHYAIPDFRFKKGNLTVWFEVKGFVAPTYPLKKEIIEATLKKNERYIVARGNFTEDDRILRNLI